MAKKEEVRKPLVVDGIEVSLSKGDFDDYEITECMAVLGDPDAGDGEQLAATVRMFRLIFKDDYQRVKDELRAKNGGRLTNDAMSGFVNECIEAAKAKN